MKFEDLTPARLASSFLLILIALSSPAFAQRRVNFPPAEAPPPPAVKAPQKMEASGEDTGVIPDPGPGQRKTQTRTPPPPTNLTVMHKVEYGETLEYVHTDGTVQKFEQWKSFPNDGRFGFQRQVPARRLRGGVGCHRVRWRCRRCAAAAVHSRR